MSELPWGVYARLQQELGRSCYANNHTWYVNDHTWGLEQGLNRLLAGNPPAGEEVDRAVRSESRKERYRTRLRRGRLAIEDSPRNPENALDARLRLHRAEAQVTVEEWALLRAVGEGHEYKEIAAVAKVAAGTLRARVLRLRRSLIAHAGKGGVKFPNLTLARSAAR